MVEYIVHNKGWDTKRTYMYRIEKQSASLLLNSVNVDRLEQTLKDTYYKDCTIIQDNLSFSCRVENLFSWLCHFSILRMVIYCRNSDSISIQLKLSKTLLMTLLSKIQWQVSSSNPTVD